MQYLLQATKPFLQLWVCGLNIGLLFVCAKDVHATTLHRHGVRLWPEWPPCGCLHSPDHNPITFTVWLWPELWEEDKVYLFRPKRSNSFSSVFQVWFWTFVFWKCMYLSGTYKCILDVKIVLFDNKAELPRVYTLFTWAFLKVGDFAMFGCGSDWC